MGSAKVSNAKPQLPMAENMDKKSIKTILKSLFHKDKKKDKTKKEKEPEIVKIEPVVAEAPNPVTSLLENLEKLQIKSQDSVEEDELNNFSIKVIEDEGRTERIDSQSSEDSGFSEAKEESKDNESEVEEIGETLENLDIKDGKKKKLRTVTKPRGPVHNKLKSNNYNVKPYSVAHDSDNTYRQVSLNKKALSGGQVIVNFTQSTDDFDHSEVVLACKSVEKISQNSQKEKYYWQDVLELINEDTKPKYDAPTPQSDDILSDFQVDSSPEHYAIDVVPREEPEPNPVEVFSYGNHLNYEDSIEISSIIDETAMIMQDEPSYIFPTPPRSENVPSPMSGSPSSFYPQNSDYTQSPERYSPTYNSDSEKYQDISHFAGLSPTSVDELDKVKPRERTASICSMTMKNFKDMQKDIALNFSKKDCCQTTRKPCKEIFQEHMSKLKMAERKNLCFQVAKMDLKSAYGVLHNILLALSRGKEQEDLQYALFSLICERVLAQKPSLFADEFGLSLIKSAVLRCPHRPLLTRYLVQCIRTALRVDATLGAGKEYIFHEVDSLGDNLLIACARAGDQCADVLAELLRDQQQQQQHTPLFRVQHANADGYTALHVASSEHSADKPRLHTVHVLLEHGGADLWKGDIKSGDTALHQAVNSAKCDLQLIMVIFKHIDRKMWKKLAHCQNMGGVTPLELARIAIKSSTRPDYPQEVLDFLKKCR